MSEPNEHPSTTIRRLQTQVEELERELTSTQRTLNASREELRVSARERRDALAVRDRALAAMEAGSKAYKDLENRFLEQGRVLQECQDQLRESQKQLQAAKQANVEQDKEHFFEEVRALGVSPDTHPQSRATSQHLLEVPTAIRNLQMPLSPQQPSTSSRQSPSAFNTPLQMPLSPQQPSTSSRQSPTAFTTPKTPSDNDTSPTSIFGQIVYNFPPGRSNWENQSSEQEYLEEYSRETISTETRRNHVAPEQVVSNPATLSVTPSMITHETHTFVLKAATFLSNSMPPFSNTFLPDQALKDLLLDCLHQFKSKDPTKPHWNLSLYEKGRPANYFLLLLEGQLEVTDERQTVVNYPPFCYGTKFFMDICEGQKWNRDVPWDSFMADSTVRARTDITYIYIPVKQFVAALQANWVGSRKESVPPKMPLGSNQKTTEVVSPYKCMMCGKFTSIYQFSFERHQKKCNQETTKVVMSPYKCMMCGKFTTIYLFSFQRHQKNCKSKYNESIIKV